MMGINAERRSSINRILPRLFGISLMLLVFFCPLASQTYRAFQAEKNYLIEQTRWQFGPFRLFPRVMLKNIGYDDNVYYQREEDKITDYTGTLSPELRVSVLFRNWLILNLRENPEYIYYLHEKRERRWNNTFSPEFKLLLFRRFVLGGNYSYQNRRRRATSEFDVRANEKRTVYKGSFFYETPRMTLIGVTVTRERIKYEDVTLPGREIYLSRRLNRDEERIRGEFYYRIFSQSFFFLIGEKATYDFLHPQSFWRNSYSYGVSTGIRFPEIGRIRGTLTVGYKKLIPRETTRRGFSGLTGNTSLQFRVWRTIFRLELSRDYPFSVWTNNIYFNYNRLGSGLSFYLSRNLRLDYNLSYGQLNYPEPFQVSGELIKRKDEQLYHTGAIVIRLKKNLGMGLQLTWWRWTSNLPGVNRDRIFFGAFVTQEF